MMNGISDNCKKEKKNRLRIFICFLFLNIGAINTFVIAQVALTDDMPIASNTSYTITPGIYNLPDAGNPGIIYISNKTNVIIDASGVTALGSGYTGYAIYINNCSNITIKNFQGAKNYKYAVCAQNARQITVSGCTFSNNKRDTIGWLTISDDTTTANGGGVYMYNCKNSDIFLNTMKHQDDGVALYNCDTIRVHDNDLSYNTAYGVRMFHANYCTLNNNNCSHVSRTTDPSDCAAILLFFSKKNNITNNNASYGGDGLFTNDNITLPHSISNFTANNFFINNNCSYSPHNAIESVFTHGNIFKHNTASNSDYGIWAGYAQNTLIDSNLIEFNSSGIDIEMGKKNIISNNKINNSANFGIHLRYDYSPGPPFTSYNSKDNVIKNNILNYNSTGISFSNTYNTKIVNNVIRRSLNGIVFEASTLATNLSVNDTLVNDSLKSCSSFNIQNLTPNTILAVNNYYGTNDTNIIKCKIYDIEDNAAEGKVFWKPFLLASGSLLPETTPPNDLAEQSNSNWAVTASDGLPTTWYYDGIDKIAGLNSLHITTASGFAVKAYYYPLLDKDIAWNLTAYDTMLISVKAINTTSGNFQQNYIELGDGCGNYYRYEPNPSNFLIPATVGGGTWVNYKIPLLGNSVFPRTAFGTPSFSNISYAYVMADTWDYGFEEWIDGFSFTSNNLVLSVSDKKNISLQTLEVFPNPSGGEILTIDYNFDSASDIELSLINRLGKKIAIIENVKRSAGLHTLKWNTENIPTGVYLLQLKTNNQLSTKKIIISEK